MAAVARSYAAFGQRKPIVARRREDGTGEVLAGNHQLAAARSLGWTHIAVVWVDDDDTTARAFALADNRTAELGGYDEAALMAMIEAVAAEDQDLLAATGWAAEELAEMVGRSEPADGQTPAPNPTLVDKFVVPPFTVLDQRAGYWQERKARWMATGIRSEEGRGTQSSDGGGGLTLGSLSGIVPDYYAQKSAAEKKLGRALDREEFERDHLRVGEGSTLSTTGTSVFDPVLCEIAYRWFSPVGGRVLDPFAGGSVRGVVAADLGRAYTGIDLREEQIRANREQWSARTTAPGAPAPSWLQGDSAQVLADSGAGTGYDLIFSCPPYADLEVYSDDPADLSNMPYDQFLELYRRIIALSVEALADDRFVVWVVGDVRDKKGVYRGLVPDTIRAFEDAGARYYNEAVLVSPVGSTAVRISRQFSAGRKLGKVHQNVLVFVKGDPRRAAAACGTVDVSVEVSDDDVTT